MAEAIQFAEMGRAAAGESGTVKLGLTLGLLDAIMRLQAHHAIKYPGVTLECTDMRSGLQYEALRRREIDIGFLRSVPERARVVYEPLFLERFVVLLSESNPLSMRKALKLKELANEPVLLHHRHLGVVAYDKTLALYSAASVTPRIISFPAVHASQAAMMLVASGKAIAFGLESRLSRMYLAVDGVAVVPLNEPEATLEVRMAWRTGENSPKVLQLLDSARAVLQNPLAPTAEGDLTRRSPRVVAPKRA
jgi:DNA-binding transcriptional LysR family regulator